jgi:glycosyltransferase involved in cell wall biosynthesis
MNAPTVSIVVPCYNEARRFNRTAFSAFAASHPSVRLLFVDDGSTDDTASVLAGLAREFPDRIAVLTLTPNRGKAEAVRQGVLAMVRDGSDIVGYWDADLATPLDAIPVLVGELAAAPGVEMVLGSRVQLLGRRIHRRAVRHYIGRVFATAASLTLGIPVYDTQCGAKVFRVTPATNRLFDEPFLSRWVFDVELLARRLEGFTPAQRADVGSLIVEYPLMRWEDVSGSKVRARDFVLSLIGLARILWRYRIRARPAPVAGVEAAFD